MKPTILLTGGSGLLAVNWAVKMRNIYNVVLLLHERQIKLEGVISVAADIESFDKLSSILLKYQPVVVVHTAGLTSVEVCEHDPLLANRINVEISANVASVTRHLGVKMVHISTDHLFDGTKALLSEDTEPSTCNVYAYTKAIAEKRVIENNESALIIRTNFYGWGTSYRKSFSDMIIFSLRNSKEINLYHNVYYSPIYMSDLIHIVHKLMDNGAEGIYNVVSDNRISKFEFGILLANEFGLDKKWITKSELIQNTSIVKRPFDMSLCNKKATEFTGVRIGKVEDHIKRMKIEEKNSSTLEIQSL